MSKRRPAAMDGISPISYTEIRNWSETTQTLVSPDDVRWIIQIDDAYIETIGEMRELKKAREEARDKAKQQAHGRRT